MTNHDTPHNCAVCKEKISQDAVKCPHCGSFQNWRRYLGASSSLLSLLVALISVLTVLITVLSNFSKASDSDIKVSIINWQRAFINDQGRTSQVLILEAFVTNAGQKPGAIKAFSVKGVEEDQFQSMKSGQPESGNPFSHEELNAEVIEPGKSLLIKKHLKTNLTIEKFEKIFTNSDLRVDVVNFNGTDKVILLKVRNLTPRFYQ